MTKKINIQKLRKTFDESVSYLSRYIQVDEEITVRIIDHCIFHKLNPEICAYYEDLEDFYSDWTTIGYEREEALAMLVNSFRTNGEFCKLPNRPGIIRFVV